jgi:hypothetical protein
MIKKLLPLALVACGGESQLYHYDYQPPIAEVEYVPPDFVDNQPSISLGVTMEHCLGPLAERPEDIEDFCPIDLSTGVCDPRYRNNVSGLPQQLREIVEEEAPVNIFDLLDGEITIPVTAMVSSGRSFVPYETQEVAGVWETHRGTMLMAFGDKREEINDYLNAGSFIWTEDENRLSIDNIPYGNFPLSHLRCSFSIRQDLENHQWHSERIGLAYIQHEDGASTTRLGVEVWHSFLPYGGTSSIRLKNAMDLHHFPEETHNIGATRYALKNITEAGLYRAHELVAPPENSFYDNRAIFLWE